MTYLRTAKRSNYVLCCGKLLFCLAQAVIILRKKYACGSYSFQWAIRTTSMKRKTGMLQIEAKYSITHLSMTCHFILTQQTSIYGQVLMDVKNGLKKKVRFCILTTVNSKLLLRRFNTKGKDHKVPKESFSHSKGELLFH